MALIDDVLSEINLIIKMRFSPSLHIVNELRNLVNKIGIAVKSNSDSIALTKSIPPKAIALKIDIPSANAATHVHPLNPQQKAAEIKSGKLGQTPTIAGQFTPNVGIKQTNSGVK